jgi:hypothetical protein
MPYTLIGAMIAYGCRDKWMLINLGDIVEIFGKNKEK